MTHYRPIHKGNRGELRAWGRASDAVQRGGSPLFEVVAGGTPRADVDAFLDLVGKEWTGGVLSYDTSALAQAAVSRSDGPALYVARRLAEQGVTARPTVRQHKSDAALAQVRQAVELHGNTELDLRHGLLLDAHGFLWIRVLPKR